MSAVSARIDDPLPWDDLTLCDAAFFTGHDAGIRPIINESKAVIYETTRLLDSLSQNLTKKFEEELKNWQMCHLNLQLIQKIPK